MPRLILATVAIAGTAISLVACGGNKPAWTLLPSADGSPYQVSIRTYNDGAYADQPFEVKAESKNFPEHSESILSAEQCKNVQIAQTKESLYIFYEEIVLNSFSSIRNYESLPRPFLCDMRNAFCKNTLREIVEAKGVVSKACTYS